MGVALKMLMLARLSWRTLCRWTTIGSLTTGLLVVAAPLIMDPTPQRYVRLFTLLSVVFACMAVRAITGRWRQPSFRFSLRSMLLVLGLGLCLIVLWRDGGPWKPVHDLPGRRLTVVLSPDGRLVATMSNSQDAPIEIHDVRTGQLINALRVPGIHSTLRPLREPAFSPDGKALLTLGHESSLTTPLGCVATLTDCATGEPLRTWRAYQAGKVAASGNRFFMYVQDFKSSRPPEVRVYEMDRDEPLWIAPKQKRLHFPLEDEISSTGRYLLLRDAPEVLQIWDIDTQRRIGTIDDPQFGNTNRSWVSSRFSPDDRYLALATKTGVDIWDVATLKRIGRWEPQGFAMLGSLEWSPKADRFFAMFIESTGATTGREHSYLVYRQGTEIAEVMGSCAGFTPQGDRLAVQWGPMRILDAQTGSLLATLPLRPGRQPAMAIPMGPRAIWFSPDGDWLVHNGGATVWHRQRSERWWGILTLPAFWGTDLFLILLLVPLARNVSGPATWLAWLGRRLEWAAAESPA